MYLFSRLVLCSTLTLILLVIELVLTHFTHSVSLLAVANQSMYNLLTLVISASTIIVSYTRFLFSLHLFRKMSLVSTLNIHIFKNPLLYQVLKLNPKIFCVTTILASFMRILRAGIIASFVILTFTRVFFSYP